MLERKTFGVTELHKENEVKAKHEKKTAVTCIKMKGLHSWYMIMREEDIDKVYKEMGNV